MSQIEKVEPVRKIRQLRCSPNEPIANRFRGQGIAKNRDLKFAAKHLQPADVVAMLVGEKDAIEFVRGDPAEREAENELARAQAAVDEQPAMVGRDQRAVSGASAPEHRQTKHFRLLAKRTQSAQTETGQNLSRSRTIFDSERRRRIRLRSDGRDRSGRFAA